ncbi:MAG: M20/M25/M40 family metallo-hydrolase [Bacteroidota bacterium]|nr:M20/M25/M40 family metallo-hydrolase [Bacteroidota bacterium]
MKKLMLTVLGCLFISLTYCQSGDSVMVKKIVDEVMTNAHAYTNLKILCKQVGQRLSGSDNYMKAVQLTQKMLKNAGADKVYLQECMVPHWVRGGKEKGEIILSGGKKYLLHLTALGNSVGTPAGGVSAPVIEIRSMAELRNLSGMVKGKIVFFNFRMNPTYITTFRAYGESGVSRTRGPALAGKYGAIGVLVRSLAINFNDHPHTGVTVYNDSFPKIPAVAISTNDAEYLSNELKKRNVMIKASFTTYCKMLPDVKGYNVIGEIKGSQFPDEIITVGGHLDSWDLAEGANDDGSGVVQSIEVLRALKALGIQPKRTIRAVLFANEENGERGADAYLAEAKEKKEKHIFALESDAGGFTPRGFELDVTSLQKDKILAWKDLFYPYGVYDFSKGGGGTDIEPLKEIGAALAGLSPDSQRYFDIHHADTDVFENVSERELNLGAANMAALIYLVDEHGM